MTCLNEIINCNGGNHYKIPHINKARIERLTGGMPRTIAVTGHAEEFIDNFDSDSELDFHLLDDLAVVEQDGCQQLPMGSL